MFAMVISYYGGTFFKISFGDTTIALNPISKKSKLKQSRFGANIALVSLNHPDSTGIENITHADREPFVIDGPGEYEIKKIAIRGLPTKSKYSDDYSINTVYLINLEGMRLCFLGFVGTRSLPSEVLQYLDSIDILFLPIGGSGALGASDAHELSVELNARVVIPMQYEKSHLDKFMKEEGSTVKPIPKLTVKKKDLEGREGDVVVLASP
jgi:hypothetical protein